MKPWLWGVPIISGYYTQNQYDIYQGFKQMGVIYGAENFSKEAFNHIWQSVSRSASKEMLHKQNQCIDGKSPKRVVKSILTL